MDGEAVQLGWVQWVKLEGGGMGRGLGGWGEVGGGVGCSTVVGSQKRILPDQ